MAVDLHAQVRGRALKKEEQEQVDIAQRVLDVLKSDKDVRCGAPGAPRSFTLKWAASAEAQQLS